MTVEIKPVIRSPRGLIECVFDEIDLMREGKSNPQRATAISRLATNIVNMAELEVEYNNRIEMGGSTLKKLSSSTFLTSGTEK